MFCQNKKDTSFHSITGGETCDTFNLKLIPIKVLNKIQKLTNGEFLGTVYKTQKDEVVTDFYPYHLMINRWFYKNGSLHNGDSTGRFWFAWINNHPVNL